MLGGGVTTLIGEFLAKRKYKSKLKKMEKNYKERTAETNSAKENDSLETINSNQTTAFDYQIEQERARESAHKTRKTVYTMATGLYAGATVAAIYEAVTKGITPSKCSAKSVTLFTPEESGIIIKLLKPRCQNFLVSINLLKTLKLLRLLK